MKTFIRNIIEKSFKMAELYGVLRCSSVAMFSNSVTFFKAKICLKSRSEVSETKFP